MVPLPIWEKNMERKIDKPKLRKQYMACRDQQELALRRTLSRNIIEKLTATELFGQAELLLIYMDFRSEVMTTSLVEALLEKKEKRVFCPHTLGQEMNFYEISHMGQLQEGSWGIREPEPAEERRFTLEQSDRYRCLVIVPGVVFDRNRRRIGYGRGFYDRFLAAYPQIPSIGLAYECQMAPEIPEEGYDRKPDVLITEARIIE